MGAGFFKFRAPYRSMQEQKTQSKEEMRRPVDEFAREKTTAEKKGLLSYVPSKLKMALAVTIIAVVSFFVATPAWSDELALPPNAENLITQEEYVIYARPPPDTSTVDSVRVALFYETPDGQLHSFEEQGYFVTTWGETLWTETEHRVEGEEGYEGFKYWITTTKGAKVLPSEREGKDVTTTYHGTPDDSLFKEITVEGWYYGESTPANVDVGYWALDSTVNVTILYTGGVSEYFALMISPPTDTINVDDLELKVRDETIRPARIEHGLAYPNPFNAVVTIRTGNQRTDLPPKKRTII